MERVKKSSIDIDQIKGDEMGGACHTYKGEEKYI
jgi:hypothetical protein